MMIDTDPYMTFGDHIRCNSCAADLSKSPRFPRGEKSPWFLDINKVVQVLAFHKGWCLWALHHAGRWFPQAKAAWDAAMVRAEKFRRVLEDSNGCVWFPNSLLVNEESRRGLGATEAELAELRHIEVERRKLLKRKYINYKFSDEKEPMDYER
jgi:hypothetical protein